MKKKWWNFFFFFFYGSWVGYCPFPSLDHDIVHCIVTQQAGCGSHDTIQPGHGRGLGLRHGWPVRKGEQRAREGLAIGELCTNTNGRIVIGERHGCWVVSRDKRDTAGGSATIRHRSCDKRSSARWGSAARHVRHSARHGQACAATQPSQACDTALCAVRAQPGFSVCTLCT